ncbi:MAG: DUF3593 domain-containing protein [Cyanobacteriota bacterium]|jgi:hypothetical protein|nr:DUF3593 domain-containing protein [Cyanobacteriota bacterium]
MTNAISGPLFVLSLLPYLVFLVVARRIPTFPRLALRGFELTLLFVAVTIVAAVVADQRFGQQLANVDPLHGAAESLLTVCNLLVALGFGMAVREINKS